MRRGREACFEHAEEEKMNVEASKTQRHRARRIALGVGLGWCIAISFACGASGDSNDNPPPTSWIRLLSSSYGTALDRQFRISQPVQVFQPTDPVCLSIELEG